MSDHLSWLERVSQEDATNSSASIDAPKDTAHDAACDESLDLKKGQGDEINDKNVSVDLTPKTDNIEVQGEKARSEESANPVNELDIKSKSETQGASASLESEDANKDLAGTVTDVSKTEAAKVDAEGEVQTPKEDEPGVKPAEEVDITLKDKPSTEDAGDEQEENAEQQAAGETAAEEAGESTPETPATTGEEAAPEVGAVGETETPAEGAETENAAGAVVDAAEQLPGEGEEPVSAEVPEGSETPVETPEGAGVTDISEPEPEVNPVEEAQAYLNGAGEDVVQVEKVEAALEAFNSILTTATDGGRLPADANLVRAIYVGLEAFNDPWLLEAMPSLEDFNDPSGSWTVSNELFDNLRGKMSDAGTITVNALKKLWDWLVDLWNALTADAAALKDQLKDLSARTAAIQNVNNSGMPLKGARRLYVGNFFVGNTPKPIMDIAQVGMAFLGNYPKMMARALDQAAAGAKRGGGVSFNAEGAFEGMISAFIDNFKPEGLGVKPAQNNEIPTAFKEYPKVAKSVTLPGNKAMYTGLQERSVSGVNGPAGEHLAMATSMSKIFKVSFESVPGDFQAQEETVKAPDAHTINTMIKALDQLVGNISDFSQAKAELNKCKEKLVQVTSNIQLVNGVNKTSFLLNGYSRAIGNNMALPAGNYLGYVHSIVKVYIAVLGAFVAHHEAGSESEHRAPQTIEA